MRQTTKNLLGIAGVISTIMGIVITVPAFLGANYLTAILATFLIVAGLVMLAIAFGD